jgi:hypothetical protein
VNLQDLCFLEKKEKKRKSFHGRDLAHNEAGPTVRIQPKSKKAHKKKTIWI